MAEIMRLAKVGETFRIVVPGVHTRFVLPQGATFVVQRHYGGHGQETIVDVEVVSVPETAHPLLIKVPRGADVLIQEED